MMKNAQTTIRPARSEDLPGLIDLTLLAFVPIFEDFPRVLGPELDAHLHPDWRRQQTEGVRSMWESPEIRILVAENQGTLTGMIAYELNQESRRGEVQFLAVHPGWQQQGIATALNLLVLDKMRQAGMTLAIVETGGNLAHAPARRAYEKAGYTPMPIVRYFKRL